ncbi:MAG: MBL fold metallo-hydrolase [Solirubrobacterales bacterium]
MRKGGIGLQGELGYKGLLYREGPYYILRQSMPYPLAENNAYIIETSDGWTVIDVGIDLPMTREVWEKAFREIGIKPGQVRQIYITHCHPDHLGAGRWLQRTCDAPVFMLDSEIQRARRYVFLEADFERRYRNAVWPKAQRYGFPEPLFERLLVDWRDEVTPLFREPYELFPFHVGDRIELAGGSFEILAAPGHTDGQVMFWSQDAGHLFLADLLTAGDYLHFTEWPHTELDNPLQGLYDTIERVNQMDIQLVLPGHGRPFHELRPLTEKLSQRHARKLEKVRNLVGHSVTAGELYPKVGELVVDYIHLHRLMFGETVGYLNYLAARGDVIKDENRDVIRFER